MNTNCRITIHPCQRSDITALVELENEVFDYSRISRRNFIRLLQSPAASILLAKDSAEQLAGYAVILTRRNSRYYVFIPLLSRPRFAAEG